MIHSSNTYTNTILISKQTFHPFLSLIEKINLFPMLKTMNVKIVFGTCNLWTEKKNQIWKFWREKYYDSMDIFLFIFLCFMFKFKISGCKLWRRIFEFLQKSCEGEIDDLYYNIPTLLLLQLTVSHPFKVDWDRVKFKILYIQQRDSTEWVNCI